MPDTRRVVAALIWDDHGRFFAARRPLDKARANLWEFPGGKVEKGESDASALRRECLEELSCDIEVLSPYMALTHRYDDLTVNLALYTCRFLTPPRMIEHTGFLWVRPDEIDGLAFCPADKAILDRLKGGRA